MTRTLSAGEFAVAVIVRPLMLVLWVFILWGTLYGAALVYAIVVVDGTSAFRRVISGEDRLSGIVSLIATGLAALVWSAIAAAWLSRLKSRARRYRTKQGRAA